MGEEKSENEAKSGKKSAKKHLKETVEAVVVAVVMAMIIRTFFVQAFKIPSSSMEDTLLIGDHILVSKFAYGLQVPRPAMVEFFGATVPFFDTRLARSWGAPERGDIIVFRSPQEPTKDYIKRIVGLSGDVVEMKERVIYVNGAKWDDPYGIYKGAAFNAPSERTVNFGPYTVPEGSVFVMGDNRDRSYDSRFWGSVDEAEIKGKALIIYWSWDKDISWVRFNRITRLVE